MIFSAKEAEFAHCDSAREMSQMNADTLGTSCRCDIKQSSGGGQSAKTVQNDPEHVDARSSVAALKSACLRRSMNSSTHLSADGAPQQQLHSANDTYRKQFNASEWPPACTIESSWTSEDRTQGDRKCTESKKNKRRRRRFSVKRS